MGIEYGLTKRMRISSNCSAKQSKSFAAMTSRSIDKESAIWSRTMGPQVFCRASTAATMGDMMGETKQGGLSCTRRDLKTGPSRIDPAIAKRPASLDGPEATELASDPLNI